MAAKCMSDYYWGSLEEYTKWRRERMAHTSMEYFDFTLPAMFDHRKLIGKELVEDDGLMFAIAIGA